MATPGGGSRDLARRPSNRTLSSSSDASRVTSSVPETPHGHQRHLQNVPEEPSDSQRSEDVAGVPGGSQPSEREIKQATVYADYDRAEALAPFSHNPSQEEQAAELKRVEAEIEGLKLVLGTVEQNQATGVIMSEQDIDTLCSEGNKPVAKLLLKARTNVEMEAEILRLQADLVRVHKQAERLRTEKLFLREQVVKANTWQQEAMSTIEELDGVEVVLRDEIKRLNALLRAKGVDPHAGEDGAAAFKRLLDAVDPQPE